MESTFALWGGMKSELCRDQTAPTAHTQTQDFEFPTLPNSATRPSAKRIKMCLLYHKKCGKCTTSDKICRVKGDTMKNGNISMSSGYH